MRQLFYRFIVEMAKLVGGWITGVIIYFVTSAYYFFIPGRTAECSRFYRKIFPKLGKLKSYLYTWKQYKNFGRLHQDRLYYLYKENFTYSSKGWEHFEKIQKSGSGGIILMSHVGNWEAAAHMFRKNKLKLLIYMGVKKKEQLENIQKIGLNDSGVKIIPVEENSDNPFDLIDGVNFLKNGGFVSLTGDRKWGSNKRDVAVNFLGYEASLPVAPHIMALLSNSPLIIFLAYRTGKKSYHFEISEPIYLKSKSRKDRENAIKQSAQNYSDILGDFIKKHPCEWYNFDSFLGEKIS